jgi:hypothetical protein
LQRTIMLSPLRRHGVSGGAGLQRADWRWLGLTALVVAATAGAGQAQQRLAGQCPLIVPADSTTIQPRRILPSQVAAKNTMGCLSPSDAVYGPDGCPVKMCGQEAGVFALPGYTPKP